MPSINIKELDKHKKAPIRTVILNLTQRCNLNCRYCFETKQSRSKDKISFMLAKDKIRNYLEMNDEFDNIIIDFFGGEPFLEFPLIQKIVEWIKSKKWKKKFFFLIETNGTILSEDIKSWLKENKQFITVGVSFDGSKEAQMSSPQK